MGAWEGGGAVGERDRGLGRRRGEGEGAKTMSECVISMHKHAPLIQGPRGDDDAKTEVVT